MHLSIASNDADLIEEIGRVYAAVSFTITTANDKLSKIIEPVAPISSSRFEAIKKISSKGIYTGIILMPVLPFITDREENINEIVSKGKEAGAKYIVAAMGMTNRTGQREYYYDKLDEHFPGIKQKYINSFGDNYNCSPANHKELYALFKKLCRKHNIPMRMKFYQEKQVEQLKLF